VSCLRVAHRKSFHSFLEQYMPRSRLFALAAIALVALAACSTDRMAAPPATEPEIVAPALPSIVAAGAVEATLVPSAQPNLGALASISGSDVSTYTFFVDGDHSKTVMLGTHMVSFPANTICDPDVTNYGPSYWLAPCQKLTAHVVITATTWTDSNGRPQVDFDKHLRFYPNNAGELPAIYLRDPAAALTDWGRVDYCSTSCVNEAETDTVLSTRRDPVTGYLYRLIRHFSGYNVWD
jgi:hypothetical protein